MRYFKIVLVSCLLLLLSLAVGCSKKESERPSTPDKGLPSGGTVLQPVTKRRPAVPWTRKAPLPKVYAGWPFDSGPAKRRQQEPRPYGEIPNV